MSDFYEKQWWVEVYETLKKFIDKNYHPNGSCVSKAEVEKMISQDITSSECEPRENSEYHLGFNRCRVEYAESKLKVLSKLNQLTKE